MNTRLVNAAADVINAALSRTRTAAGIALELDSAQLLQSPEVVAELKRRVAALESERRSTNEALDDAVQALRADGITRQIAPTQALRDDEPDEEPDFFQPGHTYRRRRWLFQCLAVAPAPHDGEVRAVGYLGRPEETATVHGMSREQWERDGWTGTTTGGAE